MVIPFVTGSRVDWNLLSSCSRNLALPKNFRVIRENMVDYNIKYK